jgi:hypothetical protein
MFRLFSLFCEDDEDVDEEDDGIRSSFDEVVDEDVEHGKDDELGMLSVRAFFLFSD